MVAADARIAQQPAGCGTGTAGAGRATDHPAVEPQSAAHRKGSAAGRQGVCASSAAIAKAKVRVRQLTGPL
jgi:hypothetical protein